MTINETPARPRDVSGEVGSKTCFLKDDNGTTTTVVMMNQNKSAFPALPSDTSHLQHPGMPTKLRPDSSKGGSPASQAQHRASPERAATATTPPAPSPEKPTLAVEASPSTPKPRFYIPPFRNDDASTDIPSSPPQRTYAFPPHPGVASHSTLRNQFDLSPSLPDRTLPYNLQIMHYAQIWAVLAAQIPNDARRNEVLDRVFRTFEKAWFEALRLGYSAGTPEDLKSLPEEMVRQQHHQQHHHLDAKTRRKRECDPCARVVVAIKSHRGGGGNGSIVAGELEGAGVSEESVQARLEARELAGGQALMDRVARKCGGGKITERDWLRKTAPTAYNHNGRDLLVYCLWEVQVSRTRIAELQRIYNTFPTALQRKNTQNRINAEQRTADALMAIALEIHAARGGAGSESGDGESGSEGDSDSGDDEEEDTDDDTGDDMVVVDDDDDDEQALKNQHSTAAAGGAAAKVRPSIDKAAIDKNAPAPVTKKRSYDNDNDADGFSPPGGKRTKVYAGNSLKARATSDTEQSARLISVDKLPANTQNLPGNNYNAETLPFPPTDAAAAPENTAVDEAVDRRVSVPKTHQAKKDDGQDTPQETEPQPTSPLATPPPPSPRKSLVVVVRTFKGFDPSEDRSDAPPACSQRTATGQNLPVAVDRVIRQEYPIEASPGQTPPPCPASGSDNEQQQQQAIRRPRERNRGNTSKSRSKHAMTKVRLRRKDNKWALAEGAQAAPSAHGGGGGGGGSGKKKPSAVRRRSMPVVISEDDTEAEPTQKKPPRVQPKRNVRAKKSNVDDDEEWKPRQ